jgi:pyrroloquinoline quinone biosynthesis protein D
MMSATRRRVAVDAATRPMLPRHVRLRHDQLRGLWLLLAPERVLTPDPIAVEVLQLCDGIRSVADVAEALAARYDAPTEQIAADVIAMLQDLADKDFLAAKEEQTG